MTLKMQFLILLMAVSCLTLLMSVCVTLYVCEYGLSDGA